MFSLAFNLIFVSQVIKICLSLRNSVLHSCWCILLFECGLNSKLYLNSNFVGIRNRREKEIEEERKPKPQPNPTAQAHSSLSLPAGPLRPSSRRGPNSTSAWPASRSGPAQQPAQPTRAPFPLRSARSPQPAPPRSPQRVTLSLTAPPGPPVGA